MIAIEIQKSFERYINDNNKISYEKILNECIALKNSSYEIQLDFFKTNIAILRRISDQLFKNLNILCEECLKKFDDEMISKELNEKSKDRLIAFRNYLKTITPTFIREKDSLVQVAVYAENSIRFDSKILSVKERKVRFNTHVELLKALISAIKERHKDYKFIYSVYKLNISKFY